MRPLLAVVVALVVATPALAGPGKVAVGLERGASAARVAAAAEARTGGTASTDLAPLAAITVRVDDVDSALPQLRRLRGVSYVERLDQPEARCIYTQRRVVYGAVVPPTGACVRRLA